jgi:hypothetical protein
MTFQISTTQQNARLDAMETALGASPVLRIRTGLPPANCGTADSGSVLATVNLPADFMVAASGGSKGMSGSWVDNSADAAGTAGHFRVYDSGGSTCHWQGSITASGGGGDMTIDNIIFAAGQAFTITSFTLTDNNG